MRKYLNILIIILGFFGLYLARVYDYLLFHSAVELFSAIISVCIFIIALNSREFQENDYFIFLGISFLFVGILDLTHLFAYKGMNIFHDKSANLSAQLWIAARYMQGISLIVAPLFIRRKIKWNDLFSVYSLVTLLTFY